METGKVPNTLLDKLILDPIKRLGVNRREVLSTPSVGEDCAVVDMGGDMMLLSTDPITGAVNDIGKLAVNINANDIAAAGGDPVGIMITALLPPETQPEDIEKIMSDVYTSANKLGIAVTGGHTEITDCVKKPVLSCTIIGRCKKMISTGGASPGDKVIATKYAGLEGTAIIAKDYADLLKKSIPQTVLDTAAGFMDMLSVAAEGRIGAEYGATAMHDVTEGGILGACYEMAHCSGTGITVYKDSIPMLNETKQIANAVKIDPYRLISSGCMLMAHPAPEKMLEALAEKGINAAVIGEITPKDMLVVTDAGAEPLGEPTSDSLYKVKTDHF